MVKQSIRLKVFILPISLALTVAALIFLVKPSFSDMNAAKAMLSAKQSQLNEWNGQSQKLKKLASDWEPLSDEKALVQTALPDTENIDIYISELTSKASRSGILLSDIELVERSSGAENPAYVCGAVTDGSSAPAPSSIPVGTTAETGASGSISNNLASLSSDCLEMIKVSIVAKGSWEQLLDFFKYLEDMNRISNIDGVNVSVENQGLEQASSGILSVGLSINAFFKKGGQAGDTMLIAGPASQMQLNQKAIQKLKETIYSPYAAPSVSPSGERNIFK
ncbi:MAG: hypothetical protein NT093_04805 [Candidatus Moranbacteria bacterium]|nr:hypothetical protein [Candidatus Moranbacteria bacterium]